MSSKASLLSLVANALLCGAVQSQEISNSLVISSWGGSYQDSQYNAFIRPYLELNPEVDIVVEQASQESVAKLQAQALSGDITYDLLDVTSMTSFQLCDEGLAIEIDHDEVLATAPDGTLPSEDFGAFLINDCFIPQTVFSTVVGFRADMVDETPDNICALFDIDKFPGMRALENRPTTNLVWALLCDGVEQDRVYESLATEEGRARAFAKLGSIKDSVVWWSSASETPQLLADAKFLWGPLTMDNCFRLLKNKSNLWKCSGMLRYLTLTDGSFQPD